ncbi:MAG: hypothetical protein M3220_10225 [Chloroflexota bacterium]|nr:hypothetical protein [Chloroflexota bacterium]
MSDQPAPPSVHQCECQGCWELRDPRTLAHHSQINLFLSRLSEAQRRWYVGLLSQAPDAPSDSELARITGIDRDTIRRGRRELETGLADLPPERQRRVGGGRPTAEKKTPR